VHAPAAWVEEAFNRAGEPKELLTIKGGHYAVYEGPGADEAGSAAAEWFGKHL
jgi:hypothetical protein